MRSRLEIGFCPWGYTTVKTLKYIEMGFHVKMWIKKADGSCASDFSEYILEKNGHEQTE